VFVEVLGEQGDLEPEPPGSDAAHEPPAAPGEPQEGADQKEGTRRRLPRRFVLSALEQSADDEGWASLSTFGSYLNKLQPDFDPRLYGYRKLSDLVRARTDLFVVKERRLPGSGAKDLAVRAR
jgi:hypothetical protein